MVIYIEKGITEKFSSYSIIDESKLFEYIILAPQNY